MTITLNMKNEQLFETILWFLSRFKNDGLEIIANKQIDNAAFEKKKEASDLIDFSNFSGMWKERDITQESLRKQAWK